MAPKLVDNEEKRLNIIYKAYDYIEKFGIKDFSTTAFIKYYKMGKSSLYHYFKSKDEILHEVYYRLALDELKKINTKIQKEDSIEKKLEIIFEFYLSEDLITIKLRNLYLEFLNIQSDKKNERMKEYDKILFQEYHNTLKEVFLYEIEKGNIKQESLDLIKSLIVTPDGMLVYSYSIDSFNLPVEFRLYLNTILTLIKIDK